MRQGVACTRWMHACGEGCGSAGQQGRGTQAAGRARQQAAAATPPAGPRPPHLSPPSAPAPPPAPPSHWRQPGLQAAAGQGGMRAPVNTQEAWKQRKEAQRAAAAAHHRSTGRRSLPRGSSWRWAAGIASALAAAAAGRHGGSAGMHVQSAVSSRRRPPRPRLLADQTAADTVAAEGAALLPPIKQPRHRRTPQQRSSRRGRCAAGRPAGRRAPLPQSPRRRPCRAASCAPLTPRCAAGRAGPPTAGQEGAGWAAGRLEELRPAPAASGGGKGGGGLHDPRRAAQARRVIWHLIASPPDLDELEAEPFEAHWSAVSI